MAVAYENESHDDVEVRLDDYLNDRIQNSADFDTLNTLIASVQTQQELLRKQVSTVFDVVYTNLS